MLQAYHVRPIGVPEACRWRPVGWAAARHGEGCKFWIVAAGQKSVESTRREMLHDLKALQQHSGIVLLGIVVGEKQIELQKSFAVLHYKRSTDEHHGHIVNEINVVHCVRSIEIVAGVLVKRVHRNGSFNELAICFRNLS